MYQLQAILGKDSYTHRISVFINFTPGLGDAVYLYSGIREASFEELIDLSLDFDQKDYATKREKLSSSYTYRAIDKRFNHQPTLDIDQMITKTGEQTHVTIVMKKNPSRYISEHDRLRCLSKAGIWSTCSRPYLS